MTAARLFRSNRAACCASVPNSSTRLPSSNRGPVSSSTEPVSSSTGLPSSNRCPVSSSAEPLSSNRGHVSTRMLCTLSSGIRHDKKISRNQLMSQLAGGRSASGPRPLTSKPDQLLSMKKLFVSSLLLLKVVAGRPESEETKQVEQIPEDRLIYICKRTNNNKSKGTFFQF